jgi:dCMP deaminase
MVGTNYIATLFNLADGVSGLSGNRGTKVGAVIYIRNGVGADLRIKNTWSEYQVIGTGVNRPSRGFSINDERIHVAPLKGKVWEHAERDVLSAVQKSGYVTTGLGMAVNWYPCADCARAIATAGITELIGEEPAWENPKWAADFLAAKEILEKANVTVHLLPARPRD